MVLLWNPKSISSRVPVVMQLVLKTFRNVWLIFYFIFLSSQILEEFLLSWPGAAALDSLRRLVSSWRWFRHQPSRLIHYANVSLTLLALLKCVQYDTPQICSNTCPGEPHRAAANGGGGANYAEKSRQSTDIRRISAVWRYQLLRPHQPAAAKAALWRKPPQGKKSVRGNFLVSLRETPSTPH